MDFALHIRPAGFSFPEKLCQFRGIHLDRDFVKKMIPKSGLCGPDTRRLHSSHNHIIFPSFLLIQGVNESIWLFIQRANCLAIAFSASLRV